MHSGGLARYSLLFYYYLLPLYNIYHFGSYYPYFMGLAMSVMGMHGQELKI